MNRDSIIQLREIAEWIREIDTGNDGSNAQLLKVEEFIQDIILDLVYDKVDK